jgi:bacterioferritin-associated ferredoxin
VLDAVKKPQSTRFGGTKIVEDLSCNYQTKRNTQMASMNKKIVCRCNLVYANEIKQFYELYPFMPIDQMKSALNIGTRCGSCKLKNSPNIDIRFEELIEEIDNGTC